jgi:DNA processing protein
VLLYATGQLQLLESESNRPLARADHAPSASLSIADGWPAQALAVVGSRNPAAGRAQRAPVRAPPGRGGPVHRLGPGPGRGRRRARGRAAGGGRSRARAAAGHPRRHRHRHRPGLSAPAPRAGAPHRAPGPDPERIPAGHAAAARQLSQAQPPDRGPGPGHAGDRGGAAVGLADHRAPGRRAGQGGVRHPGSIHSPQSRGAHALLRQGAKLVETAQDVLEELRWPAAPTSPPAPAPDAGAPPATPPPCWPPWAPTRSASTPCRRAPGCPPRCCRRGCWSWSWTAG